MSTKKPSERIAELSKANNWGAWCYAICAYLDEQHAASPPPVAPASVPDDHNGHLFSGPGDTCCNCSTMRTGEGAQRICPYRLPPWNPGKAGGADESAMPAPLPEVLPAGTLVTNVFTREDEPLAHVAKRSGALYEIPGESGRKLYFAPSSVNWSHYRRTLQPQPAPPAPERVDGMAEEVKPRVAWRCRAHFKGEEVLTIGGCKPCEVCGEIAGFPIGDGSYGGGGAEWTTDPKPPVVPRGSDGDDEAHVPAYSLDICTLHCLVAVAGSCPRCNGDRHLRRYDMVQTKGYEARKVEGPLPVRPAVAWFAQQMELALRRNDHKGGWAGCEMGYLRDRLREECVELEMALDAAPFEKAIKEAADVANFAMMIADNLRPAEERKAKESPLSETETTGEATDEELRGVCRMADDGYESGREDRMNRALYNLGVEHGKRAGGGAKGDG